MDIFNKNLAKKRDTRILWNHIDDTYACICCNEVTSLTEDSYLEKTVETKHQEYGFVKNKPLAFGEEEENQISVIKCKRCGTEEHYFKNQFLDLINVTVFDNRHIGKIKISAMYKHSILVNGTVITTIDLKQDILNLDTGYTYALTDKVNRKEISKRKTVRSRYSEMAEKRHFHNSSYERSILHDVKYNLNIPIWKINKELFFIIASYKQEKFGIEKTYITNLINKYKASSLFSKTAISSYAAIKDMFLKIDVNMANRYTVPLGAVGIGNKKILESYYTNSNLIKSLSHIDTSLKIATKRKGVTCTKDILRNIAKGGSSKRGENSIKRSCLTYEALAVVKDRNLAKDVADLMYDLIYEKETLILKFIKAYRNKYRKDYNEKVFIRKLIKLFRTEEREATDGVKMFLEVYKNLDFKPNLDSVELFHDQILQSYKISAPGKDSEKLNYSRLVKKSINMKIGDVRFELAKETGDLVKAGRVMDICVGSYVDRAKSKECQIVIGYHEETNTPRICIELDLKNMELKQFKYKFNKRIGSSELLDETSKSYVREISKYFKKISYYDIDPELYDADRTVYKIWNKKEAEEINKETELIDITESLTNNNEEVNIRELEELELELEFADAPF